MAGKKAASAPKAKAEYKVFKKRSGRYAVMDRKGKYVNADKKVEVLVAKGVVKQLKKKAAPTEA